MPGHAEVTTMFLSADDLHKLTGYRHAAKQIAQLKKLGIAFWVNAAGKPAVPCAVIEGKKAPEQPKPRERTWVGTPR